MSPPLVALMLRLPYAVAVIVLRFGTDTGGGPSEVTTEMVLPCFSTCPGFGDCEMIVPSGAVTL